MLAPLSREYEKMSVDNCRRFELLRESLNPAARKGELMRISTRSVCLGLCFFLATSGSLQAQEEKQQEIQKSCRDFVQRFYDWYLRKEVKGVPKGDALDLKRDAFSPELRRQLKEYNAATRDGVGLLDFDPFVNGQDFSRAGYAAGKVTLKNERYRVDVYCLGDCFGDGKSKTLVVEPELIYSDGQWRFMNFHYHFPDGSKGDLLSILKEDRKQDPKAYRPKRSR